MKIRYCLLITLIALFAQPLHATQTCRNDITPTTPIQDFTLHDDGTVTHHKTGLMWMRCAQGQNWNGADCTGSGQTQAWVDALRAVDGFSFAGHSDWRLPDIKELDSIIEQACINPAINATVFPATSSYWFWSASPFAGSEYYAWIVDSYDGSNNVYAKSDTGHVRLVRGGQ